MPRGHRWKAARGREAYPRHVHRFVEPCLLLLLHRDQTHGYDLLEGIKEFGFAENPVDASVVYRTLRAMEEAGLVTSTWDTTGTGPPRRVYRITAEGDRYLAWWVADLRETDLVLHRFLAAYDEHMREGVGEHH
jgi:PadR family transcriptional regulator PadR